jgi:hypothetical protein
VDRADTSASQNYPPSMALSYPWLVWNKATADQVLDLWARNIVTGQQRALVSQSYVSQVQAVDDQAYLVQCPEGRCDTYTVPLSGGALRQITHSGKVGQATVGAGGVVYNEPPTGDPKKVWFQAFESGAAVLLDPGYGLHMVIGEGFAAWAADLGDAVVVRSTASGAAPALTVAHRKSSIARMSAVDDRLVFVELLVDSSQRPIGERLHLMRVASNSAATPPPASSSASRNASWP